MEIIKRNRTYVVFFHPDGGGYRSYPATVGNGVLRIPDGTEYPLSLFVMVQINPSTRCYFIAVDRALVDEHAFWDRARRSLDWSSLTKPQSHWTNMYEQIAGVIQWVLLLYAAWQASSAASQAAQVVGYLEFLQRSLVGGS